MRILLLTAILLSGALAEARTVTFACDWKGWEMAFSTDVESDTVEVLRTYEYNPTTKISIRVPTMHHRVLADVLVDEKGKQFHDRALCLMEETL
jgi:hypothetical protein